MRRHRNYSIVHEVNNHFLCFCCEFRALYFNSRFHKVHQPVQTQMVVTPLPELLSKSSAAREEERRTLGSKKTTC